MTVIWSGVTSEGAVVPVQVDGAGRVVATTGEPPQPPVIEYNGASAWGKINSDGTLAGGLNCTTSKISAGKYQVTFNTPMPDANYSVTQGNYTVAGWVDETTQTATGFQINSYDPPSNIDGVVYFAVFSSNALPPTGGTGTDSWGCVDADGSLLASFNVASVTRTSVGKYDVVFTTPMPSNNYSIQLTGDNASRAHFTGYLNVTSNGFTARLFAYDNTLDDAPFSFQVNATNAVLPVTVTAEQLYAVTNNWYLEGESLEEGSVLTTRYKVEMQEGIKFAGGKAGITRDGELYFTSNGGKYVIAVNDEQIGLTRIDSAY